jgi:hypothetical protein
MDKNVGEGDPDRLNMVADWVASIDVYGCFTREDDSQLQTDSDGWRNINGTDRSLGKHLGGDDTKTIPMKLMFETTSRWMMCPASRIVVWTQLEWKEYIASWVGIEYSDGARDCTHHVARCVFAPSSELIRGF